MTANPINRNSVGPMLYGLQFWPKICENGMLNYACALTLIFISGTSTSTRDRTNTETRKCTASSCSKVASFWNCLKARLTLSQILPENYTMNISVALGLMPDPSKNHRQLNFCYLMARHFIWICKRKETAPQVKGFLQYLKSILDIEVKTADRISKKQKQRELLRTIF